MKIYWNNPYWMSYKKIEQRVIELSHIISFDDDQLFVYSNEIADLIITVTSKIESVLKDMYERFIYPYNFDKDKNSKYSDSFFYNETVDDDTRRKWTLKKCLDPIDKKIKLRNKTVTLRENLFRFKHYSNTIKPFGLLNSKNKIIGGFFHDTIWVKKEKRTADVEWIDAYNSLKHNYILAIQKNGNLMNLIFSLSSLYVLIIYLEFYDSKRYIYNLNEISNFYETNMESDIFSVRIHNDTDLDMFKTSFDNRQDKEQSILESTLLIIEHPEVKIRIEKLWENYLENNPDVEHINIDKLRYKNEDTNQKEYDIYKKIYSVYERNIKNRLIILNENDENKKLWPYSKNQVVINDDRFINKTKKFLSNIKVGDIIEVVFIMRETLKGELLEITDNNLVVKTSDVERYTFPKSNIKRARILQT